MERALDEVVFMNTILSYSLVSADAFSSPTVLQYRQRYSVLFLMHTFNCSSERRQMNGSQSLHLRKMQRKRCPCFLQVNLEQGLKSNVILHLPRTTSSSATPNANDVSNLL